jgi:hypothetical protein
MPYKYHFDRRTETVFISEDKKDIDPDKCQYCGAELEEGEHLDPVICDDCLNAEP